jgi:hypothetical protein
MEISPLRQLRTGKLPKMVSWYDPRLLARIGVRTIISNVFGQYADQRLIQAVTDPADDKETIARYDFRDPNAEIQTSASPSTKREPTGSTTWPTSAMASSRPTPPPICWRKTASTCAVPALSRTATS